MFSIYLRITLVIAISVFVSLPLYGQGVWVEDFSEINEDDYHIGDDAYWSQDDEFLVLTEAQASLAGRIYTIQEYPMAIFTAQFDIRIGGGGGADGMTFAWIADYNYQRVNGGALNFRGVDGFAVEFDCYPGQNDPNGQHIGLVQDDVINHLDTWVTNEGELEDNEWHTVRVVNFLGLVQVFWEDELVLEHQIEDYEPFPGHFGFTAATGGVNNWHIVDNVVVAIGGPVIDVADDPVAFGPVPVGNVTEQVLQISNVAEEEDEWHSLEFLITTEEGEGPDWLSVEPAEGVVAAGEAAEITLFANTEGLDPGEYERDITIASNDGENPEVVVGVHIFVVEGFGRLYGVVTNAENGDPLEGATVAVPEFGFSTETDGNGNYDYAEIPSWTYDVIVTKEDFLPLEVVEVEINPNQEIERDFALLHADFEPSRDQIDVELALNESLDVSIVFSNSGNGALNWEVSREFPEGMEAEPWEHRAGIPAAEILENSRLGGVEFVDDNFYVAGGFADDDNVIYVLSREGELIRQFNQHTDSRYGYRDIVYDGDLLWGVDGRVVYGFTLDGELVRELDTPINGIRGITWDPTNELLYMCGITSNIFVLNLDGDVVHEIDRLGDLRPYGLTWYPDDPDGFFLQLFCSNGEFNHQIYRANPDNGEFEFVSEPDIEGSAGAAAVNRRWDPFSWVFMGMTNSPDRIEVWHLDSPTGWVNVEPTEGQIEADEETEIIITLDTQDFPVNIEFTADLVFTHDGVGGETIIPVSLMASEIGGLSERTLDMAFGWNMVSVNVDPEEPDVVQLTRDLVENDLLEIMKNGAGQFYSPLFNFNNIPGWMVDQGYMLKTAEDCQLTISGEAVAPDQPIELHQGWQMIAYFPRVPVDAIEALSGIVESLEMAKDGEGRFYSPAFGFSNMGDLSEGNGYMIKLTEAAELIYTIEDELAQNLSYDFQQPEILPVVKPTGDNMSLLVISENPSDDDLEVGVFASRNMVGSGRITNGYCGVAIWGDDTTTETCDGALMGESLNIKLHNLSGEVEDVRYISLRGKNQYDSDALWAIQLETSALPIEFGISTIWPNPFNNVTNIDYSVTEPDRVSIELFNLVGQSVATVFEDVKTAGRQRFVWDASGYPSGVYMLKLSGSSNSQTHKVLLIR
ncbi:MAG: T9SS type A sorting domain-containing protein [Calditrichaeota bacterium]|nr:T9SS type A sorting domain-containing protein [Calditrichota bacterium]